jgi:type 1 glutamine amidotransferase/dienelactone hydrolase
VLALIATLVTALATAAAPDAAQVRGLGWPAGYGGQYQGKKKVLIIGDLRTGNQVAHDAVGHAMATIEQIGRKSGAYVSFLRSDTELVTKGEVWGKGNYAKGGSSQAPGRNLDYFDAVVFYTNGETELSDAQKQDLLKFVREDGKGFVGIHTATATAYKWPEYGEMIGGYFDNHPWNIFDAPVINERPDSPIVKHLPKSFIMRDEMYAYKGPYARDKVDVLLSLDATRLDLTNKNLHRTDGDFPIAWTRTFGKGRVFSSAIGHPDESWDDERVQTMYLEAIKWVLRMTDDEVKPHAGRPLPTTGLYQPASVPQGTGPFKAIMEMDSTLPTHTIYRPANLKALGSKRLPIVVWGNGACANIGNRFRYFLSEIVSYGYLAVATGPIGSAAVESTSDSAPSIGEPADPALRKPKTTASQLIDALNWAIAQNSRKDGPYFGRLATDKIAVMGQSCGGLQAIVAAADPRVTTTVIWNSGTFPSGSGLPGAPATKESLKSLHAPVAYISGDESDVAFKNSNADFEAINGIPVFRAWMAGVGHSDMYRKPNGGEFGVVGRHWLDWQLKGDRKAARQFVGIDCGLCKDSRWTVSRKNIS